MKIHLISYASNKYLERVPSFIREVKKFSTIDYWKIYTLEDLSADFKKEHEEILAQKRG